MKTIINSKVNERSRNTSLSGNSIGSGYGKQGRTGNGTDRWMDKRTDKWADTRTDKWTNG